ncbi:MAG TPA: hypothetical protein VK168_00735 [Saprospiraceae bacterium]|nr:hypothetical protein [Saprospiraceae bacterium]
MRKLSFFLVLTSLLCFTGWLRVATPYSPSQDLPLISITAFEVHAPDESAGQALAQAARGWQGVTAATYNVHSGLLVLSHTLDQSAANLQSRIDILSPQPVSIKVFPEPAGAKCPVPASALAVLPAILLGGSVVTLILAIMLFISNEKRWIMAPLQP